MKYDKAWLTSEDRATHLNDERKEHAMFSATSYSHQSFFRELLDWSKHMLILKDLFAEIDILCSRGYDAVHGALPTLFQGHVVIDICSADNCSAKQIDTIVNIGQTLSLRAFSK